MNLFLKISEQSVWQILSKFVTSLSTIIILSLVSRNFGPEGTGIYTLTLTYISFFYLATDLGLNAYFLTDLLGDRATLIFDQLLGMRILTSLFLSILGIAIIPLFPFAKGEFVPAVILGIGAVLGYSGYISAAGFFQARLRYDLNFFVIASSTLLSFLLIIAMIFFHLPIYALLLGSSLGWLWAGLFATFLVSRFLKLYPKFSLKFFKSTLTSAWPIALTLVLNMIYFRADVLILSSYYNFTQVGIYNVAYQIFQSALVIPTYITNSYYPLMLASLSKSRDLFFKEFKQVVFALLLISVLGIIATYYLSPFVIGLITGGQDFTGASITLNILSLGFPAFFISSVLFWLLISFKKYKQILGIYSVGLLINIILNLIFIPKYSYLAAAYITGISEYLILLLQIFILIQNL